MTAAARPSVLVVDDRPSTFVDNAIRRDDLDIVLLRFTSVLSSLPQDYLDRSAHLPTFVARDDALEDEAARYRQWVTELERPPTYFCNPQEPLQEVAQPFARLVGLPHLSAEQVTWVRHKSAMKDRYQEIGVPHAAYRFVTDRNGVAAFASEHGWPVVLKPLDSFACIGTYKIDGPDDLARTPAPDPSRTWVVEEFIHGTEFQLCALVLDGKVLDAYLSLNPAPLLSVLDGAINANITFAPSEATPLDARAVCQNLVDGLGITHGYFHGECWLREDGSFCMGEVAARISGCEVPSNHGLAYGFDMHRAILDTYVGRMPDLTYTENRAVGDLLLPVKPGRVVEITPLAELLTLPGVMDGRLKLAVGDVAHPPRASYASSGYLHIEGATAAEVEDRMHGVLRAFSFDTEPEAPGTEETA
ncbi:ATP-grasp domain-containing protein [Paractinoplanes atraurantiacus]|uniref:Biotin carboxylase n=1 Tax=Paractinoplanes atraurantiacus TaxID=1036182 RepID=A0A285J014_9ACTN|nr:ATP-grasp domain-containing protein [Actinoplanes atraurantiacus]SNY53574.1 Biotin carboxylase [Actinoplanes atraurantiacus]